MQVVDDHNVDRFFQLELIDQTFVLSRNYNDIGIVF